MIKVENIVKSFGSLTVLKGVTVEIPEKKVVAIVGPSGAGKTTLLQIMGTLSLPDSGNVYMNGENLSLMRDKQLAKFRNTHIGFVFQFHHLLPEFTALENVCMPALIAGKSMNSSQDRAKELLDFLGLSHRLTHKPSELSGGEQQRVAVARALINNPLVVLADEPSGNLDSHNKEELHNLFFKLRDQMGQTFVVVTHDKDLARMADMQISMNDGLLG
ncbi:MAG TPA: ABC transporter ATP-binding protein [Tenuifilaceae bacterium]|nr:ABC transporter ATP-binding protein [Tenuifilaceae bacterium]HPI43835.1 ABC transporter ATP-binding protein [Tenuifilaceae bacterium]HPN21366.1 ABC transporter ATP-binding protein [Tenuifilaceae bacterium]HPV55598.1 ABC transporter ATP-binding protein [Tenuifilaceae bacterium]HSA04476.1 ABC transporter ATP-binding protein [Tenuifilaceae bacterium]